MKFVQLVSFPWATLIDSERKGETKKSSILKKFLEEVPPKNRLIRATLCQHIYAKDMLSWFHRLKITDLFWPHAVIGRKEIEGIRIHPFPLYPVCCFNEGNSLGRLPLLEKRKYLYSFLGAYSPDLYLTPVRKWINRLPNTEDTIVELKSEWHFEKQVYQQQIAEKVLMEKDLQSQTQESKRYAHILSQTVFSLCPSGSGPNSIRLWESLGFGCIPVLISNSLRLPGAKEEWDEAIVRISETREAVQRLPALLQELRKNEDLLLRMKSACAKLWKKYGLNGPSTIIGEMQKISNVYSFFNNT